MAQQRVQDCSVVERPTTAQLRRQLEATELATAGVDEDVRAEDRAAVGMALEPSDLALDELGQVHVVRVEDADEVAPRKRDSVVRVRVDASGGRLPMHADAVA